MQHFISTHRSVIIPLLVAWLILIALPGGVNRWLYASSDDINLFYERLSLAFLHLSRYVSYMSPFHPLLMRQPINPPLNAETSSLYEWK